MVKGYDVWISILLLVIRLLAFLGGEFVEAGRGPGGEEEMRQAGARKHRGQYEGGGGGWCAQGGVVRL